MHTRKITWLTYKTHTRKITWLTYKMHKGRVTWLTYKTHKRKITWLTYKTQHKKTHTWHKTWPIEQGPAAALPRVAERPGWHHTQQAGTSHTPHSPLSASTSCKTMCKQILGLQTAHLRIPETHTIPEVLACPPLAEYPNRSKIPKYTCILAICLSA
jgi:hypothetical protein